MSVDISMLECSHSKVDLVVKGRNKLVMNGDVTRTSCAVAAGEFAGLLAASPPARPMRSC